MWTKTRRKAKTKTRIQRKENITNQNLRKPKLERLLNKRKKSLPSLKLLTREIRLQSRRLMKFRPREQLSW